MKTQTLKTKAVFNTFIFSVFIFLMSCSSESSSTNSDSAENESSTELKDVSLLLNWFPEAEHGGFYAALINGYYEEEGLNVEILPGGVDIPVEPRVALGRVDFGVSNSDKIVLARAAEADIVSLMTPLQISPRCIMVHEESGFKTLSDIKDTTISMSETNAFATFIKQKYPLENVRIVPYSSVSVFLTDQQYAIQGYNISEPFTAKAQGANPHVIMLADEGFNTPSSCLVTRSEFIREDPATVQAFVKASIKGWQEYMKNPAETNKYINKQNPEMGTDILAFGAEGLNKLVFTDYTKENGFGHQNPDDWDTLISQMEELNLIDKDIIDPTDCYSNSFLIYE